MSKNKVGQVPKRDRWRAVYLPYELDEPNPSRCGFLSEKEAWKYVMRHHFCRGCKDLLAAGFETSSYIQPDGAECFWSRSVDGPYLTPCGAEWDVRRGG